MTKGYYRIAGAVIELRSLYDYIHKMCDSYCIDITSMDIVPDIVIETTQDDIMYERSMGDESGMVFSDAYMETLAVHRKLATHMLARNVLLFHGSAVAVDGQVYMFTAKSGTGKSTHARLWRRKFGDRAVMVNDDKPMLRVSEDKVWVCGTPWNGKHRLDTNIELPLKAICVIHQSADNHIEKAEVSDVLPSLWSQSYRPNDDKDMERMLGLLSVIAENTPIYIMGCNMDPEAADVAWEGMNGKYNNRYS